MIYCQTTRTIRQLLLAPKTLSDLQIFAGKKKLLYWRAFPLCSYKCTGKKTDAERN